MIFIITNKTIEMSYIYFALLLLVTQFLTANATECRATADLPKMHEYCPVATYEVDRFKFADVECVSLIDNIKDIPFPISCIINDSIYCDDACGISCLELYGEPSSCQKLELNLYCDGVATDTRELTFQTNFCDFQATSPEKLSFYSQCNYEEIITKSVRDALSKSLSLEYSSCKLYDSSGSTAFSFEYDTYNVYKFEGCNLDPSTYTPCEILLDRNTISVPKRCNKEEVFGHYPDCKFTSNAQIPSVFLLLLLITLFLAL